MYSVISFVPSDRAQSNEKGHFGYISVKGNFSDIKEAEKLAENITEENNGADIISIVFGDQYIPCVNYDCINSDVDKEVDMLNRNNFVRDQLNTLNTLKILLEKNIDNIKNIKSLSNVVKYENINSETQLFTSESNIKRMKELTATQEDLNKGLHKPSNFKKIKNKIYNFISF